MNSTQTHAVSETTTVRSATAHSAWRAALYLYTVALVVMVFLAGAGVFEANGAVAGSSTLNAHRAFGVVLDVLALTLGATALLARHSRRLVRLSIAVVVLDFLQGVWVKLADSAKVLGGLHSVGALALIAVVVALHRLSRPASSHLYIG